MKDAMEKSIEPRIFDLPLELQFCIRKAELTAQDMTWDQLYYALLNLYHQRLMEWEAIKEIMASENIAVEFDFPTNIELETLAEETYEYEDDDDDDDDDENDKEYAPF